MNNIVNVKGIDCYEENGVVYLKLEACARGLGFVDNSKGKEYVRWNTVKQYLNEFKFFAGSCENSQEVAKDIYIPENIFYRLAMKAKNETAEKFQAFVADEVIPSIRKTGSYNSKALTPAELLLQNAQILVDHERKISQIEHKVKELEAKSITRPVEYYTVAGYANIRGINVNLTLARPIGKCASNLSRELGYEIGKAHDERYGEVNTYHADVLGMVFDKFKNGIK